MIDCNHFTNCSAPICPLDHPENAIWYSGENTCSKSPIPKWVKKQKRIAKIVDDSVGYFTYEMLLKKKVSARIKGIDPNTSKKGQNLKSKAIAAVNLAPISATPPIAMASKTKKHKLNDGLNQYQKQKKKAAPTDWHRWVYGGDRRPD